MIPATAYHYLLALEAAMPLKPKPKPKGIPVGSYDAVKDAAGKMKIKPKKKHKTLQQQYASKNRTKFKRAR